MRFLSFRFSILLVLSFCALMTGCSKRLKPWWPWDDKRLPIKVATASDPRVIAMQANFRKRNIKVITIGQDYLISIPSSMLFPNQSPRLTWASYALLNDIACYMKNFRKISVNVTGYSVKYQSVRREQALTLARARNVADYLWSQGIDSRLIITEGAGSDKPIVAMLGGGDKSLNSRIEITFRDAIV